jgi:hypothetical protein
MRLCQCGGKITQHPLTKNREAWNCHSCGRYEIFTTMEKVTTNPDNFDIIGSLSADTQDNHEAVFSCITPKKD